MPQEKGTFLSRNRVVLVGGVLLLLAAHLISSRVHQGNLLARPQALVMEVLRPFEVAISGTARSAGALFHHYFLLVNVARQNDRLKDQIAQLRAAQIGIAELSLENQRLTELLDLKEALDLKVVGADVIGSDATGLSQTLIINQGEHAGLKPGMGVIGSGGVVGKLIAASPNAARVLLLNDHNCAIDGIDQRSRARGIIAGVPDDGVTMKYVERSEDIRRGDPVVTSGLDGVFPRGLLIGFVARIEREGPGLFVTVSVSPAVEFRHLEEVLVLTQAPPQMTDAGKN